MSVLCSVASYDVICLVYARLFNVQRGQTE